MRLYHGTSTSHLRSILRDGILPRGGRASTWPTASAAGNVYLTAGYALYFAQNAVRAAGGDMLLVEVESDLLEQTRLLADEDAAVFAYRNGSLAGNPDFVDPFSDLDAQASAFSRHLAATALEHGFGFRESLSTLGNCAHVGAVPPWAVTRTASFPSDGWHIRFHDPVIAALNHRFHGDEYRATQLVAMGRLEEARLIEFGFPSFIDLDMLDAYCSSKRLTLQEVVACPPRNENPTNSFNWDRSDGHEDEIAQVESGGPLFRP